MRHAFTLAITALLIPAAARAQVGTSSDADSIGSVFRAVVDSVASVAGFASLRDGKLPPGVRREVRTYVGFGLGYPQQTTRLSEDSNGAHGWLGLWWPGTRLDYEIPGGTERDYAEARQEQAGWVAQVRDGATRRGCTGFRARPDYETCTLPDQRVDWTATLGRLDSLGIARLPQQRSDLLGFDGVTLLVEYRDAHGYRAYFYWMPRAEAQDSNERAAAKIMETILALYGGAKSR